jgi:hypothetical protein
MQCPALQTVRNVTALDRASRLVLRGKASSNVGLVSGAAFARLAAVVPVIQTPFSASELSREGGAMLAGLSGNVQVTHWPVV